MTLYVVATPIGNLEDITERAKMILTRVPVVFAEDTRHTKRLLDHLGVRPQLISYHHHTTAGRLAGLLDALEYSDAALVTDAGTPGVNDPGGIFIEAALARFGATLAIVPIPGPSALVTAASISGFPMDEFLFLGFPPHKKGRKTFFDRVSTTDTSVIFYESTHRISKALVEIHQRMPKRLLVVCRELTKKFETIYRGTAAEVLEEIKKTSTKGEFVIVVGPRKNS